MRVYEATHEHAAFQIDQLCVRSLKLQNAFIGSHRKNFATQNRDGCALVPGHGIASFIVRIVPFVKMTSALGVGVSDGWGMGVENVEVVVTGPKVVQDVRQATRNQNLNARKSCMALSLNLPILYSRHGRKFKATSRVELSY